MGQRDPAGTSLQQHGPELGFEPPDLCGDRRLGYVQTFGGAGEAAMTDNGIEVDQLA
jgi:hypothetical protein